MNSIMPFVQQNWMFVAAFVVVVVLLVANEINSARGKKYRISVTDALREYNDDNAVFIDLRSKKEFKKLHIPNAVDIPAADLQKKLETLTQFGSKQIIVYSDTDPRANEACIKLRKMHPNAPLNVLVGGIVGWQEANLPLSKG